MAQRTLLLDVDACLIVDTVDAVMAYASYKGSGYYDGTPVPDGARELHVTDPTGRVREVFVVGEVLTAIRRQAHAGVDIVWHTTWLAEPGLLHQLADDLALGSAVRFPRPDELPEPASVFDPQLPRPDLSSDWRMRAIAERARALPDGDDLVLASIDLDLTANRIANHIRRRSGNPAPLLGSIPTTRLTGLDAHSLHHWTPEREHIGTWHQRS